MYVAGRGRSLSLHHHSAVVLRLGTFCPSVRKRIGLCRGGGHSKIVLAKVFFRLLG